MVSKKVKKWKKENKERKEKKEKKLPPEKIPEEDNYIYVYGITNNQEIKLNFKGLNDKPIEKINFKDIAALISYYPSLNPVLEEKEAMLHAEILNKIAVKTATIPMAYGMVFKSQKILELVLAKSYQAIKETLVLIKDKIELGVKVIKRESEDMPNEVSKEILESLNNLCIKSIPGDNFSERLLLNYSFLVEKNRFSEFSDKIAELENKYQSLKFIYTGPWPVYSFVNIKIGGR